jgi:hypothetical protein
MLLQLINKTLIPKYCLLSEVLLCIHLFNYKLNVKVNGKLERFMYIFHTFILEQVFLN